MDKHDKTLKAIFAKPTRANLKWRAIDSLFRHCGADIKGCGGSMVAVALNGVRAVFHTPHGNSLDTKKGTVERVREFLETVGITP